MNDLKQDLIDKIQATESKDLLLLLKSDFEYFEQTKKEGIIEELCEEDKAELLGLIQEPFGQDTISQPEFDETIRQWLTQ